MRTAFDQAKAWGIVPKFEATPGEKSEDREKGHEAIRQACKAMEKEYRARAALMRRPPSPGPKPPRCEGAPPFPAAQNYPADPKLNEYPETEEQFEQNRLILQKLSEQMEESMGAEKKILADESSPETGVSTRAIWEGEEVGSTGNHRPVQDFAAAIREARPPRTSLEQALIVQQITDAIYASAAKGKAVAIR